MATTANPTQRLPRGAIPSPRHVLAAAVPHVHDASIVVPTSYLMWPAALSYWGNDQYGDCVTAEEAFAKAAANPQTVFSYNEVVGWAAANGYLNGATLPSVLNAMQNYGFSLNGNLYNDGPYNSVDWTDATALQSAIYTNGPVKIGVGAENFQTAAPGQIGVVSPGVNGWTMFGYPTGNQEDHCVSLCGYGTLSDLVALFLAQGVTVTPPSSISSTTPCYAMFTWNSIGIIDQQSMQNMTGEAWVRKPTTIEATCPSVYFQALGSETGDVLSHANSQVWLQTGYQGTGELFFVVPISATLVALACGGGELGQYLSHANGSVSLQPTFQGGGEVWEINDIPGGNISIACTGAETGLVLSHATGKVWLQNGYQGTGEAWIQTSC